MFKVLIPQAQHNLSDSRMEIIVRDRLARMRFLGFDLGGPPPEENTIRLYRDQLTGSGTLKRVMKAFDWQLQKKVYIPTAGHIVDASWCRHRSSATLMARRKHQGRQVSEGDLARRAEQGGPEG